MRRFLFVIIAMMTITRENNVDINALQQGDIVFIYFMLPSGFSEGSILVCAYTYFSNTSPS